MKKEEVLRKFGDNIRVKRINMNMSQIRLAELVGCSYQAIGSIERGEANASTFTVYRIARALKVHSREILPF